MHTRHTNRNRNRNDHGLRERHVRRHDDRVLGRADSIKVGGPIANTGPSDPSVRVRQNHRRHAAIRRAERAQTVVRTLLRVGGRAVRGRGARAAGRVLSGRVTVAGWFGVVSPMVVAHG